MKKLTIIACLLISSVQLWSWGGTGHKAIAEIASRYLEPAVKSKITNLLGSKTIVSIASDPDNYREDPLWRRDLGQEISNPEILWPGHTHEEALAKLGGVTRYEPWCHSFTVNESFYCLNYNLQGDVYVRNGVLDIEEVAQKLSKSIGTLSSDQIYQYISLVVHLVGDIHCPMHTLYDPAAPTGGKWSISINGEKYNIHTFWDSSIFTLTHSDWNYKNFANAADDSSEAMRATISAGSVSDWGRMSAIYCWQCNMFSGSQISSGKEVGEDYPSKMEPVMMHQLRDAGYRLAELLNRIFR